MTRSECQLSKSQYIHFHRYSFSEAEEKAIIAAMRSGWITKGPQVAAFEQDILNYTGATHALALNSCTAGLHLALKVYDIGPGDEVITTPLTFVATANVVAHVGAKVVLVDIEPTTLNINPALLEAAITPNTKAIIPVHYAGQPCDMKPILDVANAYKIPVIEDAAHAFGAEYQGQKIGTISDMTAFSFYATKNITTGEGGALTTPHAELMERLRPLSLHGLSKDAWKRYSDKGFQHYQVTEPGYKYNMTDLQASLGIVQMQKSEQFLQDRKRLAYEYRQALQGLPLRFTEEIGQIVHAHHLCPVVLDLERLKCTRDEVLMALHHEGIGSAVHFIPIHHHPYYQDLQSPTLKQTDKIAPAILSLPLYPDLTSEAHARVCDVLSHILKSQMKL